MPDHIHVARRRLLTVRQTARKLNVHEGILRRWCEHGVIRPYDSESNIPACFSEAAVHALQSRLIEDDTSLAPMPIEAGPAE